MAKCMRAIALAVIFSLPQLFIFAQPPEDDSWDDLKLLRSKGTLIFHDSFDREESGNLSKAIGNGWNSATADRVPDKKQADLDQGILKIDSAPEANHAAHIHHEAGFKDGGVLIRFKFPGIGPKESLQIGFVDRETKGIHAGHLCYALLNTTPAIITIMDWKTGVMNLENRRKRDEALKAGKPIPEDLQALFKSKQTTLAWKPDREWHNLALVVVENEMRVSMDGKAVGKFRSEGFAHPNKRWFSMLVPSKVWVDDVKIWKLQ